MHSPFIMYGVGIGIVMYVAGASISRINWDVNNNLYNFVLVYVNSDIDNYRMV